jgi:spore maturation protein CgeB
MASILYFGDDHPGSTAAHRAQALQRLGHKVILYNPLKLVQGVLSSHWLGPIHYRTGYRLLQTQLQKWILQDLSELQLNPDLIWINSGELLGPECLKALKQFYCPLLLYNNDDPTGKRDGRRFDLLLQAIPFYDLCVVLRKLNVAEYKAKGAQRVVLVSTSYDEVIHAPFNKQTDIPADFRSDVAFIGTWMRHEKRDEFLLELIRQGIPISIWGGRWEKSPHWKALQPAYRGGPLGGRDYVAAIQGATICLGMLSKGNRDLHTRRSVEIPFSGGLLCAERTTEHQAMYEEGEEAVFWSDAAECAEVCRQLLADDERREKIRQRGMRRVRALGVGNENVCSLILDTALPLMHSEKAGNTVI